MIKVGIIAFFFLISAQSSFAQKGAISGKVVEFGEEESLLGASVVLIKLSDTTIRYLSVSNQNGNFKFQNIAYGKYELLIGFVGYRQLKQKLDIVTPNKDLGILALKLDTQKLKEVVIEEKVVAVKLKGDTTEINAKAFKSNPDANAEDLIRKMPGITDEDGSIQAQGEKVQKVLVDGKEFFGEDPNLALKNLPAEVIDKIEVFDQLSEQSQFSGYDDGQTVKTINIVTKVEMRNGLFGQAYGGGGSDERYKVGGSINHFNGNKRLSVIGLANNINQQNFSNEDLLGVLSSNSNQRRRGRGRGGQGRGNTFNRSSGANNFLIGQQNGITTTQSFGINFTNKWVDKIDLNGSYFFNRTANNAVEQLSRETFISDGSNQFYGENNQTESINYNHRLNLRINYQIDRFNSLILTPRLSYQNNSSNNSFLGSNNSSLGNEISETADFTSSNNEGFNFNNTLLYRHRFKKRGRTISFNIRTTISSNDAHNEMNAINQFFRSSETIIDSINQETTVKGNGFNLRTNIVYTEPIFDKSQLQLTYSNNFSENLADNFTYNLLDRIGENFPLDSTLSNSFQNEYTTHQMGIGLMKRAEKLTIRASIGYQLANLDNDQEFPVQNKLSRQFNNFLPRLMLRFNISKEKNLRLFYRSQTNMPSISQLQNVVDNGNPLLLRSGNAQLKQDFTHTLMARYTHNNAQKSTSMFALLMLRKTNDYIGNNTLIAVSDTVLNQGIILNQGSQFTRPINLDGYWNARSFFSYGLPVTFLKSNLNVNTGITYNRIPGRTNEVKNIAETVIISQGLVLGSNISQNIDFTITYNGKYNIVRNSIQPNLNDNYYLHTLGIKLNLIFWKGINLKTAWSQQMYRGLTNEFNQDFLLWNMSVGKKLFKEQRGEIRLTVFDLLNQNRNINRSVTETYIEDVNTQVLRQYAMLSFIYNIRNFTPAKRN